MTNPLTLAIMIGLYLAGAESARAESLTLAQTAERGASAWRPLFNGHDLSGWYTFLQEHGKNRDPDRVVTIEEGAIHLYKHAADGRKVVMGYIASEKEFGNYDLRFQYRWGEKRFQPRFALKRDAGFYYHMTGPDAVWPRGLQFQVQESDVGDLLALHVMQLDTWIDPATRQTDPPTFQSPEQGGRPRVLGGKGIGYQKRLPGSFEVVGWNTVEVVARGDSTTHLLNGHIVNHGTRIRLVDPQKPGENRAITRGRIALEIEAAEIFFRKVEIRMLDSTTGGGK
jgi:hypothetical protein